MIGSFSALKASRISPMITAMLIAPTTTGLRSRKGRLISGLPRKCERSEQFRGVRSLEVAPARAGLVVHRDRGLADADLAGEVAEVEVEPRAVDGGATDLPQLDRQHRQGPGDLGLAAAGVGS